MPFKIKINPDNIERAAEAHTPLSTFLKEHDIDIWYPCAESGSCGKCKIRFVSGAPEATPLEVSMLEEQEVSSGVRLACRTCIEHDCEIEIPQRLRVSPTLIYKESAVIDEAFDPVVEILTVKLDQPSLVNFKSDEQLVLEGLKVADSGRDWSFALHALQQLPKALRMGYAQVSVTALHDQIIEIFPSTIAQTVYALCVDLGTTSIVASLIDLANGRTLATDSVLNPQVKYGDDLISRVSYSNADDTNLKNLQKAAITAINALMKRMISHQGGKGLPPVLIVVAANTVMTQLLLGIDPRHVAALPFTSTISAGCAIPARETGLEVAGYSELITLPVIGGFIGGDIIADMLVAGFGNSSESRLLIDIGTNCEVVLEYGGRRLAASAPAGPALEGARIACGVRALPGAIADVAAAEDGVEWLTIDDREPLGICGSGLFHIIEHLVGTGLIDSSGRILIPAEKDSFWRQRLVVSDDYAEKILIHGSADDPTKAVWLTQQDIREFQLAKSAIVTTWQMLSAELGCDPQKIDHVYIAGAFGNYIRPDTLSRLGIVPRVAMEKIRFIGNAALEGARLAVVNKQRLEHAGYLAATTGFRELATDPKFQDHFVDNLAFSPPA